MALVYAESFDVRDASNPDILADQRIFDVSGGYVAGRHDQGFRGGAGGTLQLGNNLADSKFTVTGGTIIMGMAVRATNNWVAKNFIFRIYQTTAEIFRMTAGVGTNALQVFRQGVSMGNTSDNALPGIGSWKYLEVKLVVHNSAGTIEVRSDGVSVFSASGLDTQHAGTDLISAVLPFQLGTGVGAGMQHDLDDIYICDGSGGVNNDFLGPVAVEALAPTADGVASWVGSDGNSVNNYDLIDYPHSTADYVKSATVDADDRYVVANPTAGSDVKGVIVEAHAYKDGIGPPKELALLAHSGGTTSAGSDVALGTTATLHKRYLDQNPVAAAPWTYASLRDAEFGIRVRD